MLLQCVGRMASQQEALSFQFDDECADKGQGSRDKRQANITPYGGGGSRYGG
jgi:hypothetical protein